MNERRPVEMSRLVVRGVDRGVSGLGGGCAGGLTVGIVSGELEPGSWMTRLGAAFAAAALVARHQARRLAPIGFALGGQSFPDDYII